MNDDNPPPPKACCTCYFWVVSETLQGQGHCDRTHKLTHWDDACRNWDREKNDDSYGTG